MTNLMYFSLFGGVMLLVYGIRQTGEGLQKAAGQHLKQALNYLTRNRVYGLALGVLITCLTQSSTATTVMLVGFVNSGIMQFSQTLAVILGADIGTTVLVQIIAFNILNYSILLIGLGLLAMYAGKTRAWKDIGQAVLGLGFIFLSMKIMSDAMLPLGKSDTFKLLMVLLKENPFLTVVLSAAFTAMVASSAATIGVTLTLASQGLIDLQQAIPIIFGANIGTSATALIVGFSGSTEARRVAYAHTLFKVVGVAIFFPFIKELAGVMEGTSALTTRQIANTHSFFNIGLAILFLPFSGVMAKFLEKAVTGEKQGEPFGTKYLDKSVLSTPSLALSQAARETIRMAGVVEDMLDQVLDVFLDKADDRLISDIEEVDDRVDKLDRGIRFYLAKLSNLEEEQSKRQFAIISITSDLENIGDIIDKNIMALAHKKLRNGLSFSKEGFIEITDFYNKVRENFSMAVAAFTSNDLDIAQRVMKNNERIEFLVREYRTAHIERLRKGLPESFETSAIHLDLLSNLERINSHITHIAYTVLECQGAV
ncbi:MAG: Na/Pi cotransporter family protein [Nitrospirota bacterium]